jgi:hypothetical protein
MNLLTIKRNYDFNLPLTGSIDLVSLKFTKLLNLFNFVTDHDSDVISFKNRFSYIDGEGPKNRNILSVFSEGYVRVYSENNKLKIDWTVKLDKLYFISILLDTILVLFFWHFLNTQILYLIIIAVIGFLFSWFIGTTEIISKINEINTTCLNE